MKRILEPSNKRNSLRNRINPRKSWKILRRFLSAPKRTFETVSTQKAPRCIGMNATLSTFFNFGKSNKGFFSLYYISCKEE
jgi:hypothetical protein